MNLPLGRRKFFKGVLASASVLAASGTTILSASGKPQPRLDIAGSRIVRDGHPFRLLGVAVGDPIYIRAGRPLADYDRIAETWSANCVRVSLHPGHWKQDRARAAKALGDEVAAARKNGLYVILCWHAIGFPGHFTARPEPDWGLPLDAYESDASLAKEFWREMSVLFGRDPGIVFELWNEPVVDERLWKATGQHWPLLKPLWEDLIGVIRPRSENLVLATGAMWAHDLKGIARAPIDDRRTAYAWHVYPPWARNAPSGWGGSLDGLEKDKPIVVTEWGFCRGCGAHIRGTAEDFGAPLTRALDAMDLGSTAWCWSGGAAPAMLQRDWATPTEYGRFVQTYLAAASRGSKQTTVR